MTIDAPNFRRLVAPPGYTRRVDVPLDLVEENLRRGFRIDPMPDDRAEIANALAGSLVGRSALCMASGPSMVAWPYEDLSALASLCTCWATNNAYEACGGLPVPRCHYLTILDSDFWDRNRAAIRKFEGETGCLPCLCFQPSEAIRYMQLAIPFSKTPESGPPYQPGHYWHGNSSGVAAVQMALHARPRRVFLLGHDCTVAGGRTHGSGVRSSDELRQKYPQGRNMLAGYSLLAKHAAQLGVEIYNLSPWSAVKDFPVLSIKQAVELARKNA